MPFKRKVLLLQSAYDPEIHQTAVEAARKNNWHLDANVVNPMIKAGKWRGDGILCSLTDDKRYVEFIEKEGVSCVDLSTWRQDLKLPRVSADNNAIGRIAARHFIYYEHRHFAWYASAPTQFGEACLESFSEELKKHMSTVIRIDGRGSQSFSAMAKKLKNLPRPCAIFVQDDADAALLANLCMEEGFQVPMDFAILGVNNNPLICDVHSVPLSSIDRDTKEIVLEGAHLLQQAMDGKKIPVKTTFIPPKGVITRASSDAFVIEDELVRRALRYLQNHLAEKNGTPEVAAELGVSRSLLNQRFQKVMHSTLHQHLISNRLNKSADLLAYTNWNMERIAAETGFTHASHLSNSFKKYFGYSPLTYRRSNR